MKVTFRLFAHMRLAAGHSSIDLDLPEGTGLSEALEIFYSQHPVLLSARATCMTAVGLEYASLDQVLKEGDEVALIPPVQGG